MIERDTFAPDALDPENRAEIDRLMDALIEDAAIR
jgi:hypothetical protein